MTAASELGPRLRTLREGRGLAILKVADELRLDSWIIDALEAGQFERVGAPVYAKGHLRRYATLLGLTDGDVAVAIESLMAPAPPVAPLEPAPYAASPVRFANGLPWRPIATLAGLAIIVVGALWWKPWRQHVRAARAPAVAMPRAAVMPSATLRPRPAGTPSVAATSPPRIAAPARSQSKIAARAVGDAGDGTQVGLEFSKASWLAVRDAAGKLLFRGIAPAGTSRILGGRAPFAIVLGYQQGVKVQINGRVVQIADSFVKGNVARFQAGADGTLRPYTPAPQPRR